MEKVEVGGWEELFTSIIEDADSNVLIVDDEFRVIALNPGFYWIFLETYQVELKKGTSILKSMEVANATLAKLWRARCLAALGGTPLKVEDAFEFDGRTYYWEITFSSKRIAGKLVLSVFSRDVTIRKVYQQRIVEKEANLRSILDTIEDSIWMVDSNYNLIDFNKKFYHSYKGAFNVRLAKGKNVIALIPQEYGELRDTWCRRYREALKGNHHRYTDTFAFGAEPRVYEIKTYPIRGDGEVTGITVYARDITQQKKAEDTLKAQNEELIKINCELDRFVYSASHDLRAPLMSVKGLLNMIRIEPDTSLHGHYLQLIDKSVDKLDKFISDIIHYSRNSRLDIEPDEIDFMALVEESIESLKYMTDAERVKSIKSFRLNAPFYSDYGRLLNIFNNVISNAVRYHDRWKDSYIKIDITTDVEKARIVFEDNGIGIADEFQDQIFKMFFRASTESKGSGLGLYIVKSTIERLGGIIHMRSKLGEGTVFEIEIPNYKRPDGHA